MDGSKQRPDKGEMKLPPLGKVVMVRCSGFRCLAYRDKAGIWRDLAHDEKLPEVLEVLLANPLTLSRGYARRFSLAEMSRG